MPRPNYTDRDLLRLVGARVRQARERKGWTQEQMAERLSVGPETVSRYETGAIPLSLTMLVRVAGALGVEPVSLLPAPKKGQQKADDELLGRWKALDADGRRIVLDLLRRLVP